MSPLINMLIISCIFSLSLSQQQQPVQIPEPENTNTNTEYDKKDSSLSQTERARIFQNKKISNFYRDNFLTEQLGEFSFEVGSNEKIVRFFFHLATDHTIHFIFRVLVLKNNMYSQIDEISNQDLLRVTIFKQNKAISEQSLYFSGILTVDGKKGGNYRIDFNSQTDKLVIVGHTKFLSSRNFQGKVQSNALQECVQKIQSNQNKLEYLFKVLRTTYRVQFDQRSLLDEKMQLFSNFQIIQTFMIVALTFVQTHLVSRLFKTQSII